MSKHRYITTAAVAALALGMAGVVSDALARGKPMLVVEQAFETRSTEVSLPARVGLAISLPGCDGKRCPTSVVVTPKTRFYDGKREVSLADLRAKLGANAADMVVLYDPKSGAVTRIKSF